MDAAAFEALAESLRANAGLAAKADIGVVAERLGLAFERRFTGLGGLAEFLHSHAPAEA